MCAQRRKSLKLYTVVKRKRDQQTFKLFLPNTIATLVNSIQSGPALDGRFQVRFLDEAQYLPQISWRVMRSRKSLGKKSFENVDIYVLEYARIARD